jgi:hypothetical protein
MKNENEQMFCFAAEQNGSLATMLFQWMLSHLLQPYGHCKYDIYSSIMKHNAINTLAPLLHQPLKQHDA